MQAGQAKRPAGRAALPRGLIFSGARSARRKSGLARALRRGVILGRRGSDRPTDFDKVGLCCRLTLTHRK